MQEETELQVRIDGAFDDLEKIRSLPIVANGQTLRLADIAEVRRGYEDPATFLIRSQGEPALLLGVVMREGWNGLDLGQALETEVAASSSELPLGDALRPQGEGRPPAAAGARRAAGNR